VSKRLVLEARSPGSFAAGAVVTIADAAKNASAITVIRAHRDVGFLSVQVRMGCKYSRRFDDSWRAQPAGPPIADELAGK